MKEIILQQTTAALIKERAIFPFEETGKINEDGTYTFPVNNEVAERLEAGASRLGLSIDDFILRMLQEKTLQ